MGRERVLPDQVEELELLGKMTSDTHKVAIPLGMVLPEPSQLALERLMMRDWLRLIDVSTISTIPGVMMRVFRVMPEAVAWYYSVRSEE